MTPEESLAERHRHPAPTRPPRAPDCTGRIEAPARLRWDACPPWRESATLLDPSNIDSVMDVLCEHRTAEAIMRR